MVSDLWRAYDTLGNLSYDHMTVNHKVNFVDPVTHATTNHVECMWNKAKQCNKSECGTSRTLLDSYLIEFMYRQQHKDNFFNTFVSHIRNIYPF